MASKGGCFIGVIKSTINRTIRAGGRCYESDYR